MSLARYLSKLGALLGSDGKVPQAALAANVAGNGPAFRAKANSSTSLSASTSTKIIFGEETFDSHGCYDPALSRFKPTVAGYYYICGYTTFGSTSWGTNGAASARLLLNNGDGVYTEYTPPNNSNWLSIRSEGVFYMNGTTDYVEFYAFTGPASAAVQYGGYASFYGFMVRAA